MWNQQNKDRNKTEYGYLKPILQEVKISVSNVAGANLWPRVELAKKTHLVLEGVGKKEIPTCLLDLIHEHHLVFLDYMKLWKNCFS